MNENEPFRDFFILGQQKSKRMFQVREDMKRGHKVRVECMQSRGKNTGIQHNVDRQNRGEHDYEAGKKLQAERRNRSYATLKIITLLLNRNTRFAYVLICRTRRSRRRRRHLLKRTNTSFSRYNTAIVSREQREYRGNE